MRDVWKAIKDFFARDWTPAEKILVIVCCLLLGTLKGFWLAPIKRGISCGNNNGNTYNQLEDDFWMDEED